MAFVDVLESLGTQTQHLRAYRARRIALVEERQRLEQELAVIDDKIAFALHESVRATSAPFHSGDS